MSVSQVIAASGGPLNRGSHLSGDTCHMMPPSLARRAGGEGPHRVGVDPVRPARHPGRARRRLIGPGPPLPGRGPVGSLPRGPTGPVHTTSSRRADGFRPGRGTSRGGLGWGDGGSEGGCRPASVSGTSRAAGSPEGGAEAGGEADGWSGRPRPSPDGRPPDGQRSADGRRTDGQRSADGRRGCSPPRLTGEDRNVPVAVPRAACLTADRGAGHQPQRHSMARRDGVRVAVPGRAVVGRGTVAERAVGPVGGGFAGRSLSGAGG